MSGVASPGGEARDWIALRSDALPTAGALAFVVDPAAGGIDVFLGTTRAQTAGDGRQLIALDYQAYDEMAFRQLTELAVAARNRWPIVKLVLWHRTGRVALAEPSVLIAVSAPHRTEAFAACRWLIDTLKADVAIWKQEIWSDGSTQWIAGAPREGP